MPHLYCILIDSDESTHIGLFAGLVRAENLTVTGTVAGEQTLEYEFGLPGEAKKKYRTTVPVLVNPVIRAGGRLMYSHSGTRVKWPLTRPAATPKLLGVDSPLAAVVAGRDPLVVPAEFSRPHRAVTGRQDSRGAEIAGAVDNRTAVLNLLDARTGTERHKFPLPRFGCSIAFAPDGKTVAIGAEHPKPNAVNVVADCPVYLVDVATGKPTTLKGNRTTWMLGVDSVAFSADGDAGVG